MGTPAFSFGTFPGGMADLVVSPSVQVSNQRSLKEGVSTGGVRWAQRARRNPRSWAVSRPWQDKGFIRRLAVAAHGLGGDVWLYDRACAQQNLLPARLSAGLGAAVTVAGMSLGAVTWTSCTARVLAGRVYTISAWAASGSPLSYTLPGGSLTAMPTVVSRLSVVTFTPTVDGVVTLSRTTQVVSGVRIHEGIPDGTFYATEGTPCRVAVADPDRTYQLVTDTQTRTDYQVTLLEVGDTGS